MTADECIAELTAVCLCGCPPDDHEDYSEDGEICLHPKHNCVRTSIAVRDEYVATRRILQDLCTHPIKIMDHDGHQYCDQCGLYTGYMYLKSTAETEKVI